MDLIFCLAQAEYGVHNDHIRLACRLGRLVDQVMPRRIPAINSTNVIDRLKHRAAGCMNQHVGRVTYWHMRRNRVGTRRH